MAKQCGPRRPASNMYSSNLGSGEEAADHAHEIVNLDLCRLADAVGFRAQHLKRVHIFGKLHQHAIGIEHKGGLVRNGNGDFVFAARDAIGHLDHHADNQDQHNKADQTLQHQKHADDQLREALDEAPDRKMRLVFRHKGPLYTPGDSAGSMETPRMALPLNSPSPGASKAPILTIAPQNPPERPCPRRVAAW